MSWQRIGKVIEAKGLGGEFYVVLFSKDPSGLATLREFALASDDAGPHEVFKVERSKAQKDGLQLKGAGIGDRTAAEKKRGLFFYVSSDAMVSKKGDTIFLSEIKGFTVENAGAAVGPIKAFASNGPQDLLLVEYQGREAAIPFVEAFLEGIDFEARIVRMNLPEGLLEVDE